MSTLQKEHKCRLAWQRSVRELVAVAPHSLLRDESFPVQPPEDQIIQYLGPVHPVEVLDQPIGLGHAKLDLVEDDTFLCVPYPAQVIRELDQLITWRALALKFNNLQAQCSLC